MQQIIKNELKDFFYLITVFAIVQLVYYYAFGVQNGEILTTNDGIHWIIPYLSDISNLKNDLDSFKFGGILLNAQVGIDLVYRILTPLRLSIISTLNISILVIHIVLTYLLFSLFKSEKFLENMMKLFFITIVYGFAPVIFYRIHYGHLGLALTSGIFLAGVHLLKWLRNEIKHSLVDKVVITYSVLQLFFTSGYFQLLYYTLLLLIYFALFFFLFNRNEFKKIRLDKIKCYQVMIFITLFTFVVLVYLYPILSFYIKGFAFRGQGGSVVFNYVTNNIQDVWSWLFLSQELNSNNRGWFFLHETNFPILPVFLLFIASCRDLKKIAMYSFIIIFWIAFTMNFSWLTKLTSFILPGLGMFRVPVRLLILVYPLLLVEILSTFFNMISELNSLKKLVLTLAVFLSVGLLFVDNKTLDYILLSLLLITLLSRFTLPLFFRLALTLTCFVFLTACLEGSIARARPFINLNSQIEELQNFGEQIRLKFPELNNPLVRVSIDPISKASMDIPSSVAALTKLNTVDGYGYTSRRFAEFMYLIDPNKYFKGNDNIFVNSHTAHYDYLAKVFNLKYKIGIGPDGNVGIFKNHNGAAIQIPKEINFCQNFDNCVKKINYNANVAFVESVPPPFTVDQKSCEVSAEQSDNYRELKLTSKSNINCFVIIPLEALLYSKKTTVKFIPVNLIGSGLWVKPGESIVVKLF